MPQIEISNGYAHYPCGCKFKVLDTDPIRLDFDPHMENLPLDCPSTWELIGDGNTKGVFQLESRFGQQYAKKLKPENIEQLAALTAIMRPGCVSHDTSIVTNWWFKYGEIPKLRKKKIVDIYRETM